MQLISTSELRKDLSEYLEEVKNTQTPLLISRFGKPIAVISPFDKSKKKLNYKQYYGFLKGKESGTDFENRVRRNSKEKKYIQELRKQDG